MPLDPARGIRLTRTYIAAFVDQHLRGIPERLLPGPTADFSEITFHNNRPRDPRNEQSPV
jgi:hypothetical protein